MNSVCITGHLTADPVLKTTPNGIAVTRVSVAVNRKPNANGEKIADFINVVIWRKSAENVSKYCVKGSLVGIQGRLQTGSYDDKNGEKRHYMEVLAETVTFLGGSKKVNNQSAQPVQEEPQAMQTEIAVEEDPFATFGEEVVIDDDDLPFR